MLLTVRITCCARCRNRFQGELIAVENVQEVSCILRILAGRCDRACPAGECKERCILYFIKGIPLLCSRIPDFSGAGYQCIANIILNFGFVNILRHNSRIVPVDCHGSLACCKCSSFIAAAIVDHVGRAKLQGLLILFKSPQICRGIDHRLKRLIVKEGITRIVRMSSIGKRMC